MQPFIPIIYRRRKRAVHLKRCPTECDITNNRRRNEVLARGPTECDMTIASQRIGLGSPKGCHTEFIPPTGSPEPNNGLQAGVWRRSRAASSDAISALQGATIYSFSACAKKELQAPSKARLGRRRHGGLGARNVLVLPRPPRSTIQSLTWNSQSFFFPRHFLENSFRVARK